MKKFCHRLKPNKTGSMPRHMIFFDTETYTSKTTELGQEQRLKLYTALYYRRGDRVRPDQELWTHGFTPEDLALFVLSHCADKRSLYVFSANLWFDLRVSVLLPMLHKADFKVKSFFAHGKCFLMKCIRDKQSIMFINIQNIFPVSVAKIGELIGRPKTEVDFTTVSDSELLEYCYNDTRIIFEAMKYWFDFVTDNDLGSFGVTLASQAFNAYRHRFMPIPIYIHDNVKVTALERSSYFGGRTECFFIGEIKNKIVYALDVNSQYPYVMKRYEFPHVLRYYTEETTPEELYSLTSHYAVVAFCKLKTDIPVYAKRLDDKTVFPIGVFNTSLCTGSFQYAFEHGHVEEVYSASVYRKAKIFENWVDAVYKIRQDYMKSGNYRMTRLVRLLLNSLYGKFGQRSDKVEYENRVLEEDYTIVRHYSEKEACWYKIITIGTLEKMVKEKATEAFHSFPAISSHVTDYARLYLWELMNVAGRDNVYYVDTDSLYVNHAGYVKLKPYIDKIELGKLKLETKVNYFKIYGPKDYVLGDKVVLKGIPKSAKKLSDTVYECDLFPGMKRDLQKGMADYYCIEKRTKHLQRDYNKGVVLPDGSVIPFSLQESSST